MFDPLTRRSWRVGEGTSMLLRAIADGWQPGTSLPPQISSYPGIAENVNSVLDDLQRAGLLAEATTAPWREFDQSLARSWSDFQLPLVAVPPVRREWRQMVLRGALITPVLGSMLFAWCIYLWSGPAVTLRFPRAATLPWHLFGLWIVGAALLFKIPHELGHAVALGAAAGQRVSVGVRIFYGFPQAYTDTASIVTIPELRLRCAVLLAGVGTELIAWGTVSLALYAAPGLVPRDLIPLTLFGAPLTLIFNLLLPFFKNDGYFLVQELSGIRNLTTRGRLAAASAFFGPGMHVQPWWLPWYGLVDVHLRILPYLALSIVLGLLAGALEWSLLLGAIASGVAMALIYVELFQMARDAQKEREEPLECVRSTSSVGTAESPASVRWNGRGDECVP